MVFRRFIRPSATVGDSSSVILPASSDGDVGYSTRPPIKFTSSAEENDRAHRRQSQDSTTDSNFDSKLCPSHVWSLLNPQVSTKSGRWILMIMIVFFSILATAGIFVQVYTDAELSDLRKRDIDRLNHAYNVAVEVFDVILLLCEEMQVYYFNNNNALDTFMQQAEKIMQKVDQKLIFSEHWPTDFSAVSEADRAIISSATSLKTALQSMRNLRKAPNGTSEKVIVQVYSNIIDNLMTAMRLAVQDAPRYPGWHAFLSTVRLVQSFVSFKRFLIVSVKLARENRTISSVYDPIYQSIVNYLVSYQEYASIGAIETSLIGSYLKNLSEQESAKDVDFWTQYIMSLDFINLDTEKWEQATARHAENINWIISELRSLDNKLMNKFANSWPTVDVICLTKLAMNRELMPVRASGDTCVLIMDISNIQSIISNLDFNDVANFMAEFFLAVETILRKYNCFKIDVHGDCIALGSGVGEGHAIDHCLEMVYAALDIRDVVQQMNDNKANDAGEDVTTTANLRIGISLGFCFTRIVYLQLPRMVLLGEVTQAAALMHSSCLPMKVQVAEPVFNRLESASDLEFMLRGPVEISETKGNVTGYWVRWTDENQFDDNFTDSASIASFNLLDVTEHSRHRRHCISRQQLNDDVGSYKEESS